MSGARVLRRSDGVAYAKLSPDIEQLRGERERTRWLGNAGLPAARVLDWVADDHGAVLVTSAVPGVPACDVPAHSVPRVGSAIADILRALHSLAVGTCPFDRRLRVTVPLAARSVAERTNFQPNQRPWPEYERLLAELLASRSSAEAMEAGDLVVCHGDACLPNVVLDPDTWAVTGLVDLGRLGVADRYLDLALVTRSIASATMNRQYGPQDAAALLQAYGLVDPDAGRIDFYRLLDEFC